MAQKQITVSDTRASILGNKPNLPEKEIYILTTCDVLFYNTLFIFFFFNDPAPPEFYTLSLPDALPILRWRRPALPGRRATPAPAWWAYARRCAPAWA